MHLKFSQAPPGKNFKIMADAGSKCCPEKLISGEVGSSTNGRHSSRDQAGSAKAID